MRGLFKKASVGTYFPLLMSNIHKNGNIASIVQLNYAIFIKLSLPVTRLSWEFE